MRICINYCINCGAEYDWQASGNEWYVGHPIIYNDREYCPDCKKSIIDALALIPIKSVKTWIDTDLIDLKTLLEWEKQWKDEEKAELLRNGNLLPRMQRVFSGLYSMDRNEHSKSGQVKGRNEHSDKIFGYFYWPSTMEMGEHRITVLARMNATDGNLIKYEDEEN